MTPTDAHPIDAEAWVATELGDPATVLARRTVEVRAPGPQEIRVAVDAFCLNFNDIDIIKGRYATLPLQPPFVPGMETVGVVESAGPGAEHLVGRRIVGIPVMAYEIGRASCRERERGTEAVA